MNRQQKYLIASLCYIILFSVMNNTMFNIALPTLSEAFALTYAQVSWAVISYGILFAVGSVTYGKLADLFPVRWLIVIGLGVFAAGSLIGFLSAHFIMVIIGRIVQGMGASAIPALAMLVAARYFPQEKRGPGIRLCRLDRGAGHGNRADCRPGRSPSGSGGNGCFCFRSEACWPFLFY